MIEVILNDRVGKKIRVKCNPDDTVGDLKKLVAAQCGVRAEKIRIQQWYKIFKDHITLLDYEIKDGMGLEFAARTLASTSSSPFAVQSSPSTPVPARVPIRVGMLPFTLMPWLTYDTETNAYTTGFLPEFWRTVASLGCDLRPSRLPCFDIEFVPITDPDYTSNSTAVVRRWLLENKIDVGFDSDTHLYYDDTVAYTHPMAMSWTVGLLKKEKQEASFWEIFGPFTLELWVALLLSILFGSVVLQALSYIASDTKLSVVGFGNALYHTAAAVLGGDEYDLYHVAPLGRLYRMGLLFLILISSATYTANLAAFLTKPSIAIRGPRSMEALAESTACLRHAQYERYAQPFIRNKVVPPSTMSVYDRIEWAYGELASGNCDVIIENDVNARSEMLERCDSLFVDETVQFSPMYTFNLVRRNETQLALWLSEAIMVVMTQPVYGTILARTMKVGRSCEDNEEIGDTTPIEVTQMAGMFIVFGATGAIAVLVTLLDRCKTKKPRKPEDFEADVRDGMEKLEEKIESLQTELRGALAARGGSGGSGTGGGAPRGAGSSCVEHMMAPTAAGTNHGHDAGDEVVELQDVVAVEHAFDNEFENDHVSGRGTDRRRSASATEQH
eukprot:g3415.t1